MKTKIGFLLLLILLIPTSLVLAKGRQPDKVLITGPGLSTPGMVTDTGTSEILWRMRIPILPNIEDSYAVSFFQRDEQGKYTQFYTFNYYPQTVCEHGLIFDPHVSNRWFFATPEGEAAISRLIRSQATSERPSKQAANVDWATWVPWMVAFGVTLANGIVILSVLRRKQK